MLRMSLGGRGCGYQRMMGVWPCGRNWGSLSDESVAQGARAGIVLQTTSSTSMNESFRRAYQPVSTVPQPISIARRTDRLACRSPSTS
ncbi:hypothetical protein RSAG8_07793, partial [Rhizoctonia solani AG-8 WAC10335]